MDITLLALESCISLAALVLFAHAYPDRFRSSLWENGGVEGWNSNPKLRVYFYANHREPPEIPLIWTQGLTDSNLAIAILSFTIFLVRAITYRSGYLLRSADVFYSILLAALWTISILGQASGDFSDPQHISYHPWYLTRSCDASWQKIRCGCRIAQASFALSILSALLSVCRLLSIVKEALRVRREKRARVWDMEENICRTRYRDEGEEDGASPPDALSPVLAFFPEAWDGKI